MKDRNHIFATTLAGVACFALLPMAQAVVPAPDGGYSGGNTAEGQNALLGLTGGIYNTGVGIFSLLSLSTGKFNTGVGAGTLLANTADQNTATGAGALLSNSTGEGNTANGAFSLFGNTIGNQNTATGISALQGNIGGENNTAIGTAALFSNTAGNSNTALGAGALFSNIADDNTATGFQALFSNTTGFFNTASGEGALAENTQGSGNTALGYFALHNNTTGGGNIAIGVGSGTNLSAGNNNIYIGNVGAVSDSNTTRIGFAKTTQKAFIDGIRGVTTGFNDAVNVVIDSAGQLGTISSSRRFKKEIRPMANASEAILGLKPVTFHYKSDARGTPQFGLIAEEVAAVDPDLVVRDQDGEIYTVRYDAVNAMLLNEFLKEHNAFLEEQRKVQEQAATIARLEKEIQTVVAHAKEQDAQIQKVSAQINVSKSVTKVAEASQ
jgi:Chaperone of endosialidase